MKVLSKPLSSPGRPDKFPPPLLRFLRSNAGSRSRGRSSRSSPIFHLRSKKRPPGGVIEATQEPSSPKVTCIGQVRVCRKQNAAVSNQRRRRRRRCLWFNKALFRCRLPKSFFRWFFRKWNLIFRSNCYVDGDGVAEGGNCNSISRVCSDRKTEKIENQSVSGNTNTNSNSNYYFASNYNYKIRDSFSSNDSETEFYRSNSKNGGENGGDVFGESKRQFLESPSSSSSPPKNALLLTRCRSAPYGSSTLGGRFSAEEKLEEVERRKSSAELEKPRFEGNSSSSSSNEETEKIDGLKEKNREIAVHPLKLTSCSSEEIEKIDGFKEKNREIAVHPLKLRRCKSEPAMKGERFGFSEEKADFLRLRRSEDVILSLFLRKM